MSDLDPFVAAMAIEDPAERADFLSKICSERPELKKRLAQLLADYQNLDGTLAAPDHSAGADLLATAPIDHDVYQTLADAVGSSVPSRIGAGTVISGRYTLASVIGEGGMGAVYLAHQSEPVKRDVALKLIKAGTDSSDVVARFEAERQALALMDHPGIASIYDGGTTEWGQPFFVMELVRGVPLTMYCDEQRLNIEARLALFALVCQAVQHAHQKGIIHRDLKPGNVLVTEVDGQAAPKVIDFGVAKAIEQKLTDQTLVDAGVIVGTPAYMSPEQANPASQDIDTRTDVYALGVILYELLVGSPPLETGQFGHSAIVEMLRMIREVEPPRPSDKLASSESLDRLSAQRGIEPAKLGKLLSGELDWVAMKALEKDRDRRYESAGAFAQDIQRYLANEVVEARPPSTAYRLRKLVRRNRGAVVAASVVLLALLVAVVGTGFGLVETGRRKAATLYGKQVERARDEAVRARDAEESARIEVEESAEQLARIEYGKAVQVAHTAWRDHQETLAADVLNGTREDLRGWEWDYVDRLSRDNHSLLFTLPPSPRDRVGVEFSPDGKRIALSMADGAIQIWDVADFAAPRRIFAGARDESGKNGHAGFVRWVAFSPSGDRLATSGVQERSVKVWDVEREELLQSFVFERSTGGVSWHPDGRRIAISAGEAGFICDATNGETLRVLRKGDGKVMSAAFSLDGSRIVTSATNGAVQARLWDPDTGEIVKEFEGTRGFHVLAAINHDGSRVAICTDSTIGIWDSATGELLHELKGHTDRINTLAFSRDGSRLATSSGDTTARIWDVHRGRELNVFGGHADPIRYPKQKGPTLGEVNSVAFSPDGTQLVTCGQDGTVKIWDAQANPSYQVLRDGRPGGIQFASCSPDHSLLALAIERSATIEIWNTESQTLLQTLRGHQGRIWTVVFHPQDSSQLLSAGDDRTARRWDVSTGQQLQVYNGHEARVWNAQFNADGSRLATAGGDGSARIWDTQSGEELLRWDWETPLTSVSFSPDGKQLVVASKNDATAIVYDLTTAAELRRLEGHTAGIWSATYRPDGRQIATGSTDGTARLWDVETGQQLRVFQGHSHIVLYATFNADGSRLLTSSRDTTAKLWDPDSGADLLTLRGHSHWVFSAQFSPDESKIVTSCGDAFVRIWDGTPVPGDHP